ncbi:ABC transporter permease [Pseudoxanthobacter sp.]|uniref:cell division protein FtsX n=1 Tax=Pseudoxanthobacter sp. TaxID=1925742 RepID=UPI002FE10B93
MSAAPQQPAPGAQAGRRLPGVPALDPAAAAPKRRPFGRRSRAGLAPIVPAATVPGRALILVVAIMCYLACLTVAGVGIVEEAASDWSRDLNREVTIQIRPLDGVDMGAALDKAVSLAEGTPGIGTARVLSADETRALLQPWLGSGLDLEALPVPRLIAVDVSDPARADLAGLSAALSRDVRGASLDDHSVWSSHMAAMAASAVAAGFAILVLMMTAMVLCVVFATRAAMAANREVVEVLHFVGAENRFIAREFQHHFWMLGLKGGLAGGALALVTFLGLSLSGRSPASPAADQAHALFGTLSIGWPGYVATLAIAALAALLAAWTSRLAVHSHLRRLA